MGTWIFQANPDSFDVDACLAVERNLLWTVRQRHYAGTMRINDRVFLWRAQGRSGAVAGIIAEAVIEAEPREVSASELSSPFWRKKPEGHQIVVPLRVVRVAPPKRVVTREQLLSDETLRSLTILRMPNATNYPVQPEDAQRLFKHWRRGAPRTVERIVASRVWRQVEASAAKAMATNAEFTSPVRRHRYRLMEVEAHQITVERLDAYQPEYITPSDVKRAIEKIQAAGGTLLRGSLHGTVAKETAIVFLYPDLHWTADRKQIELRAGHGRAIAYAGFGDAPPDDPDELQMFARRVRRGQPKFRKLMLALYERRCAISGHGPAEVLDACHIDEHAVSGSNKRDNGILLRSDLHDLFDLGMLRIDSVTLTVDIDDSLRDTPYADLSGRSLRTRTDGGEPNREALKRRVLERNGP
jgi:hypothetical protein